MEKDLSPEVIKATQTSLGKYVKRPPLSDKLLKKPPFRFLHDIITSVLKTNNFFEGLFEEDELISDNVKDRESKIQFLNKVISVLALTTGRSLSVKPSKIVAGQEPEKTNELLQCLAYALDKKLSSNEAVIKYKENTKNSDNDVNSKEKGKAHKSQKNISDSKKLTSRSSEKLVAKKEAAVTNTNKSEKLKTTDVEAKRKDVSSNKNETQNKKTQNFKTVDKKPSVEKISKLSHNDSKLLQGSENIKEGNIPENIDKSEKKIPENPVDVNTEKILIDYEDKDHHETNKEDKHKSTDSNADNKLNSSMTSQDFVEEENVHIDDKANDTIVVVNSENTTLIQTNNETDDVFKQKDEPSAPGEVLKQSRPVLIPKHESFSSEGTLEQEEQTPVPDNVITTQSRNSEITRPPSVRPSSSRPGAPRLREKLDNIVPENDNLLLGKVNIITENTQMDEEEDNSVVVIEQSGYGEDLLDQREAMPFTSNQHGHLVQQILNSQIELSAGKTEIEWHMGAQKAKEATSQEIEQLRYNIQALSRVANPLGKLLDHIQEDVEVMRQELHQWSKAYEDVSKEMAKEKGVTEETLVPLQTRVKQLDLEIEEKRDKISDIKILISKNTTRIEKLLAIGNVQ